MQNERHLIAFLTDIRLKVENARSSVWMYSVKDQLNESIAWAYQHSLAKAAELEIFWEMQQHLSERSRMKV